MNYRVKIFRDSFQVDFTRSDNPENNPLMEQRPENSSDLYMQINGWVFKSLADVKKYLRIHFRGERMTEAERWRIMDDIKELSNDTIIDDNEECYSSLNKQYEELREKIKMLEIK